MTGVESLVLTIGKIALVFVAGIGIKIAFSYFDGDDSGSSEGGKRNVLGKFNR